MNLVVMFFTIHFHDTVDAANFKGIGIWCNKKFGNLWQLKGTVSPDYICVKMVWANRPR